MYFKKITLAITLISLTLGSAFASVETDLLATLKASYPDVQFSEVKSTPSKGIYEVRIGQKVLYSDSQGEYFFPTMVDMKTKRDLGNERNEDLARIDFKSLPLKDAIKTVKGNGKRVMAVWSDPDCPYCVKLEKTLEKVTDVTIYTFPFPIDQLHPQARSKSISAWCASNKSEAWRAMLVDGITPPAKSCDNPIERNQALAQKLNIHGTPALIFADGRIIPGAAELAQINQNLDKQAK